MDAKAYAAMMGVDIDEAVHRLSLQDTIGELNRQLFENERSTFAGLWIQHTSQFRIVVQFTQDGEKTIRSYVENGSLADIVEIRTASISLAELEAVQTAVLLDVRNLNVPIESGINVFQNRVELYVTERSRLNVALKEAKIQLPNHIEVIVVDELSTDEAYIYAGLTINCTTGFSVKHYNGTKGILTAAHCNNVQSYNGTTLPSQGAVEGGSYDFPWHTAPGFTVINWAFDGQPGGTTPYYRIITATEHRDNQVLNSFVCKYGMASAYTCGFIIDKNYKPTTSGSWLATFIRIHRDGVDLSSAGDSGAPWFLGNTAYGVHESGIGDDSVYMAVNYVSYLGLTILTNELYLPLTLKN